jgi:hypothetical protein
VHLFPLGFTFFTATLFSLLLVTLQLLQKILISWEGKLVGLDVTQFGPSKRFRLWIVGVEVKFYMGGAEARLFY